MRTLYLVWGRGVGSLGRKTVSSLSPSLKLQLCLRCRGQGSGTKVDSNPGTPHSLLLFQTGADRACRQERPGWGYCLQGDIVGVVPEMASGRDGHQRKQVPCLNKQREAFMLT